MIIGLIFIFHSPLIILCFLFISKLYMGKRKRKKESLAKMNAGVNHCGLILPVNFPPIAKRTLASDAACRTLTSIHVHYQRKWEPLDWTLKKDSMHHAFHFLLLSLTHKLLTTWWTWFHLLSHYPIAEVSFTILQNMHIMTLVYQFVNT